MKILKLFLLFITLFVVSCYQKHSYLFYNKNYYTIDNKKKQLYKTLKKNLRRNFLRVNQKEIKSFGQIKNDIKLICEKYPPGLLVLENFISPLVLKQDIKIKNKKFKLLTYDINTKDIFKEAPLPTFNITIDTKILNNKILELLKKYSKKKKLSDCAVIINEDYSKCKDLKQYLSDKKITPIVLSVYEGEEQKIKEWFKKQKSLRCIVFFAFASNKVLLDEELRNSKINYIEIFTNYGKLSKQVKYNISINWNRAFIYALHSKKFKKFLKKKNFKKKDKNFVNFIIKYDNIITVNKNLFPLQVQNKKESKKDIEDKKK